MFDILLFALPLAFVILALLLAVTVLAASWRWVAVIVPIVSGLLIWAWLDHSIIALATASKGQAGEQLALVLLTISTWAFGIAVAVYAAGLVWWKVRVR
jgi:hypothetical protein